MNLEVISYFNVALSNTEGDAKALSFEEVNAEAAQYGWLVHPDCCNSDTLRWVREVAKTKYNKTFYKEWADIVSKTRFELLVDQLCHYASTYGTGFTEGEGYMPNHDDVVIPFKKFKVILPCTKRELFDKCAGLIKSGIAMNEQTQKTCSEYVVNALADWGEFGFSIDDVKNKEAQATIAALTGVYPQDEFALLRCLVYRATGSTMLIKSKDAIACVKKNASKIPLGVLSEAQLVKLSRIFLRFKPLFLAMKASAEKSPILNPDFIAAARKIGVEVPAETGKRVSNASVVNKLRKLAEKNHIEDSRHRDRDADPRELEEAEAVQPRVFQCAGSDQVRRCANDGNAASETAAEGHRHKLSARGNPRSGANPQYNRKQRCRHTYIGEERTHESAHAHADKHQTVLAFSHMADDPFADPLGQPRMKHGRAHDEHTGHQHDHVVGKAVENIPQRNKPGQSHSNRAEHRRHCQRQELRDKKEAQNRQNHNTCDRGHFSPSLLQIILFLLL